MRILVTGNMGYVGAGVVEHLRTVHPDARLVGLDLGYFASILAEPRRLPECHLNAQYFGDTRPPPPASLDGVAAVVHLGAISNDPMGTRFERVTLDVNYRASVALAAMAKAAGVSRFVFASSCSVYGCGSDEPRTEDASVEPLTAYSRSKLLAEQ